MNIFKGNHSNSGIKLSNGLEFKSSKKHSGEAYVGMRPEDFSIDPNGLVKIQVDLIELVGSNSLIHGRLENSNEILVASVPGVVDKSNVGKKINLSFDLSKLHLFDVASGQRI